MATRHLFLVPPQSLECWCPLLDDSCKFTDCMFWLTYDEDCTFNQISYNLAKIAKIQKWALIDARLNS